MEVRTLPRYVHIDDIVIVGTDHRAKVGSTKEKQKFWSEIRSAKHHFTEGYSRSLEVLNAHKRYAGITYEYLFLNKYGNKITFLEDNSRWSELSVRYGIREDLFGIYRLMASGPNILSAADSIDGVVESLRIGLTIFSKYDSIFVPEYSQSSVDKFLIVVDELVALPEDVVTIANVGSEYVNFLREIRDYEVIALKFKKHTEEMEGKKALVIGDGHVDYIANYLRNETVEKPKTWQDFVCRLDQNLRDFVYKVENELFSA